MSVISDHLPGWRLLRHYQLGWLRGDVVAGIVLAAYLLPAAIGDASLAGLIPWRGLRIGNAATPVVANAI